MKYILYLCLILGVLYSCNKEEEIKTIEYTYNAFPDILFTRKGKLICVFYNGWHHESIPKTEQPLLKNGGRLMITESLDSGKTWTKSRLLIDTQLDDRDPSITQLKDGRILCNFFGYKRRGNKRESEVLIIESADEGLTWTQPVFILDGYATTSPIRDIGNGALGLTSYSLNGGCFLSRSFDSGATWQFPIPITYNMHNDFSEPDIIKENNRLLVVMRSDIENMHFSESFNNGLAWSTPRDIGFPGASPYLFSLGDSLTILSHRIPTTSIKSKEIESYEWSENHIIDYNQEANGAYPSFAQIKEGQHVVCYYFEKKKDKVSSIIIRNVEFDGKDIKVADDFREIDYTEVRMIN